MVSQSIMITLRLYSNRNEKGTKGQFGLGLSIVHKTCTMYGYNVTAVNQETGVSFIIEKKYN